MGKNIKKLKKVNKYKKRLISIKKVESIESLSINITKLVRGIAGLILHFIKLEMSCSRNYL